MAGPFSAQIQQAIRWLWANANAWVGVNTFRAGTGTATFGPSGRLTSNTTSVGTSAGVGEETLWSWPLPLKTFDTIGQILDIWVHYTTAVNGNNKTIKLKFGTTTVLDSSIITAAPNNRSVILTARIFRTGANAQLYVREYLESALAPYSAYAAMTEIDTAAIVIAVTGQDGAPSANDIVFRSAVVEFKQ